ncbi:MAG: 1-acyl-sn-glycerol-3-phosphate acyltransferase [Myxococcota bacterium]
MSMRSVRKFLARLVIGATGWKPEGARPAPDQYVLIAAPHTTNWDFLYLIAFAWYFEMQISFMAKHSLFWPPLGWIMRAFGGLPVQRHKRTNLVTTLAGLFEEHDRLALVVPAEGTRAHVDYWKSGFYHIAKTAKVPIVMSFLDWERKVGGFGPAIVATGDVVADMDAVRAFYADKKGKVPERFGRIRLREEDDVAEADASAAVGD